MEAGGWLRAIIIASFKRTFSTLCRNKETEPDVSSPGDPSSLTHKDPSMPLLFMTL